MRVHVNESARTCRCAFLREIYASDILVTQVCLFSLRTAAHRDNSPEHLSARTRIKTCLHAPREGPRSLDGCHYTAYHQNVRMGLKAAAVEQVDSGCLSDNRLNSELLTPPRISDRLLAEYRCANTADAKSTVITDLFQTTGMGIENASID